MIDRLNRLEQLLNKLQSVFDTCECSDQFTDERWHQAHDYLIAIKSGIRKELFRAWIRSYKSAMDNKSSWEDFILEIGFKDIKTLTEDEIENKQ